MKASSIPSHEQTFFSSGKDAVGKQFVLKKTSADITAKEKMVYYTCTRDNNDKSFYYEEETPKNRIVLHFTAGYLKGDVSALSQPGNHVSVPFILARNGEILNMWPSKFWSYHLGSGAVGGNTEMSKTSPAIEISNIGCLNKVGNNLVSSYSQSDIYCSLDETSMYTEVKNGYRGFNYYASYTTQQYDSLITLLRFLTMRYNIPATFLPIEERFLPFTDQKAKAYKGITSHVNFRTDKLDIGPAFDWDRVIKGVQK